MQQIKSESPDVPLQVGEFLRLSRWRICGRGRSLSAGRSEGGQGQADGKTRPDLGLAGDIESTAQVLDVLLRLINTNAHAGQPLGAGEGVASVSADKLCGHAATGVLNEQSHRAARRSQRHSDFAVARCRVLSTL